MSVRLPELTLVVLLAACRGEQAKAPPSSGSARTGSSQAPRPTLPENSRPPEERAALEQGLAGPEATFRAEPIDPQWAPKMAATIKGKAPWAEVECRNLQCRVAFVTTTAEDAMAKTDELRQLHDADEQPLAQWSPMPPIEHTDGSLEIRLYAHFTRE